MKKQHGFLELTVATVFGLVALAASVVGVFLGQIALSRRTPPPPKAQAECISLSLSQTSFPDYQSSYSLTGTVCNKHTGDTQISSFGQESSIYISNITGGLTVQTLAPGDCRTANFTIYMNTTGDNNWLNKAGTTTQAKIYGTSRNIDDWGCYADEVQTLTFGTATQPQCATSSDCNDANSCTTDTCDNGTCRNLNVTNGTSCNIGGLVGVCNNGICVTATATSTPTPTPTSTPPPSCGNGTIDPGEECETNADCTVGEICTANCQCVPAPTNTPTPSSTPTGTLTPSPTTTPCYFKRTLKLIDMATGKLNNDGTFTWQSNYEGTGTVVSSYTFERNNLSQSNLPFNDQIRLIPPDGWEIRSAFCELPQIKEGYPSNLPVQCYVQDKTVKIAILCGAIYEYGWLVKQTAQPGCENCVGGTQKRFGSDVWDLPPQNGKIDNCQEACLAYFGPQCTQAGCGNPGSTDPAKCCWCKTANGVSCSAVPYFDTDLDDNGTTNSLDWDILVTGWVKGDYNALDASLFLWNWAGQE